MKHHNYKVDLKWTGNLGKGTLNYSSYERSHLVSVPNKYHSIKGSSDPSFRGDPSLYNPEELFISSLASCHMLWYLHLCSVHNIIVLEYSDEAEGIMEETQVGSGKFVSVVLNPKVKILKKENLKLANDIHIEANKMCFIANSCNLSIHHKPEIFL